MCTFLLFVFISRLANGITMGNKTSLMKTDKNSIAGSTTNLRSIISEEDYLPMPRSMRKDILKTRRFQRVLPTSLGHNIDENKKDDIIKKVVFSNKEESCKNYEVGDIIAQNAVITTKYNDFGSVCQDSSSYIVTPIVTIFDVDEKSKSLPNARLGDEGDIAVYSQYSSPRKSHITNRNYSLIDIKTGLAKSQFTLDLEDRLRESKRQLGFDAHLSGWKEFSYKVESSKDGMRRHSLDKGIQKSFKDTRSIDKNIFSSPTGSVDFRTNNCQILGLCSVGRSQVFHNSSQFEPSVFNDEISRVDPLVKTHSKKVSCPCDLCTLAFLTDMNCHGDGTVSDDHKSKSSRPNSDRTNRVFKEKVRITDNKHGKKSIEVSVRSESPDRLSSLIGSNLSTETKQDITNSRIRNMFKENDFSDVREIYANTNSTYNDISVEELQPKPTQQCDPPSPLPRLVKRNASNKSSQQSLKYKYRKLSSSTMTGSFASSSSLSTVLSYRRVRQIFQKMIEGTRAKKGNKLDVLKFKEMEELGLGKFRNNRWYPSECKTFSIWKDMNESVQGLQGEFKKYKKSTNKF